MALRIALDAMGGDHGPEVIVPAEIPEDVNAFKFDLMRIAYDPATGAWGSPETVMAYSKLGASCAFPRPSGGGEQGR